MPIAFAIAFAASLGIHAAALFGTDAELFGGVDEPVTLRAELQPPPAAAQAAAEPKPVAKPRPKTPKPAAPLLTGKPSVSAEAVPTSAESKPSELAPESPSTVAAPAQEAAKPMLPAKGTITTAHRAFRSALRNTPGNLPKTAVTG